MIAASPVMTANWSDEQRALFQAQLSAWQKDEVVGVLLALFLGTFGAHQFYLRRPGLGILYVLFFWTGIPTIVSIVECFFMPGRVRQFNLALATYFAAQLAATGPTSPANPAYPNTPAAATQSCPNCGSPIPAGANFCGRCGTNMTSLTPQP